VLNASTGVQLCNYKASGWAYPSLAVAEGMVYFKKNKVAVTRSRGLQVLNFDMKV